MYQQLQEQIRERNVQVNKLQHELQELAEDKIQMSRDAKEEAKRIRDENATGENAELVAERDNYKVSWQGDSRTYSECGPVHPQMFYMQACPPRYHSH